MAYIFFCSRAVYGSQSQSSLSLSLSLSDELSKKINSISLLEAWGSLRLSSLLESESLLLSLLARFSWGLKTSVYERLFFSVLEVAGDLENKCREASKRKENRWIKEVELALTNENYAIFRCTYL